jgi:hypothetical protein
MWNDRDRKQNEKALKEKLNKGRERELITKRFGPTLNSYHIRLMLPSY